MRVNRASLAVLMPLLVVLALAPSVPAPWIAEAAAGAGPEESPGGWDRRRSPLRRLAWLAGSWSSTRGDRTSEEHWTTPDERMMIGMNRSVRGGRTVMFEFLRIVARGDSVFYVAQPAGRAPTEFVLQELTRSRVVFANPAHDFPQRIVYERRGRDGLTARTEGDVNGKRVAEQWSWRRGRLAP